MIRVRFTPHPPLEKVQSVLEDASKEARDWRPAWRTLRPQLALGVAANIVTEGASIGERWAPLNAKYARRKALEGHGSTPMVRSGAWLGEQRSMSGGGKMTRYWMSYYSRKRYSYPLQRGGGKAPYPARRAFGFSRTMEEQTLKAIEDQADAILAGIERGLR